MGGINLIMAPIRSVVRFPLFQLAIVVLIILLLQSADDHSLFGQIFFVLDKLVDQTVALVSSLFNVKSFTKAWLTSGFMIAYVYLACLLLLYLLRLVTGALMDVIGRRNVFWLRKQIARERGIAAYRAWLPLERIRPTHIPQEAWEEQFAWPANNRAPYRSLSQRILFNALGSIVVGLLVVFLLQAFTPFPVFTWLGKFFRMATSS